MESSQITRVAATPGRLTGRVALVTGAAQGIGQALATRLAQDGADVVIAAHRTPPDDTEAAVKAAGVESLVHHVDVSLEQDVADLAAAVNDRFGRVDILVNNAGAYPTQGFLEMTYEEWRAVFTLNVDSVFHTCRAFVPGMVERGWGRVINLSSTSYMEGMAEFSHYNATKAAIVGFTRSLATEIGPSTVTANILAPGLIRTPTTDAVPEADGMFGGFIAEQALKRTGAPEDLAGAASWLASEDASFVTGQTILVDGGWHFG
jgi:NAD(P)-dependent dehydrogenase (short-subunit alcohol dehydrogenase family)